MDRQKTSRSSRLKPFAAGTFWRYSVEDRCINAAKVRTGIVSGNLCASLTLLTLRSCLVLA